MGNVSWLPGFLVNPDIAYILLVVGIFGVIFEIGAPGTIAPGAAGAAALVLSFLAFSRLPTNIGGLIFIAIAVALFIVDIKAPTHGVLTAAGIVAFVSGSLLLFPVWRTAAAAADIVPVSPTRVSPVTIVVMTLLRPGSARRRLGPRGHRPRAGRPGAVRGGAMERAMHRRNRGGRRMRRGHRPRRAAAARSPRTARGAAHTIRRMR
jgi:hypothetical protein